MKRQLLKKRSSRSRGFLPGRFMENDWICSETSSSCLKISFNAGARWSIYHPQEQAGEHFEIRSTKIRCESSAIDKNEGFLFFFFFLLFSLLCFTFPFIWTQKEGWIFWGLRNAQKKKTTRIKFVCSCISPEFFSAFSSFFLIIFLRGNWFKIEQWQRESTWRFACSQETQEPTREYISRTVKIGCISFMKILLCIAGGTQWIYLVHLPHRSDLLYYCTSCLRLIFRQTCILRENENACADRKF